MRTLFPYPTLFRSPSPGSHLDLRAAGLTWAAHTPARHGIAGDGLP
jgi:hypothetical protein